MLEIAAVSRLLFIRKMAVMVVVVMVMAFLLRIWIVRLTLTAIHDGVVYSNIGSQTGVTTLVSLLFE